MATATPTLKRYNHRAHPCKAQMRDELLELLLSKNSDKSIIVSTSDKTQLTTTQTNVTIVSDEELASNPELKCEMLISYDLPEKAITYMARIARASTYATIILDSSQEKLIHPIETLIGRTIMQELIEGFSEEIVQKQVQPTKKEFKPREQKREYKPRDGEKAKKPYSKDSKGDKKPWEKKEKKENKFLGKDENGKAIFSGKSGERNHRHDGTPKERAPKLTGKKINIKSLKKREDSE
jgi:hypothetical protein